MSKAIAYLRVSTDQQRESGLGLDAQQHAIALCADRLGLTVATTFTDTGVSGAKGLDQRPGLVDAIQALQRGDVLLVAKRDRIARDTLIALLVERAVREKRARIVSAAGEGTETDDPTSQLLRTVLDAVAQFERTLIAARTRAALAAKRARGERAGTIRYGYRLSRNGRTLEPHPSEQRTLALLRQCRAAGQTRVSTARALNEAGYTTRAGSDWTPNYIASLEKTHASA